MAQSVFLKRARSTELRHCGERSHCNLSHLKFKSTELVDRVIQGLEYEKKYFTQKIQLKIN